MVDTTESIGGLPEPVVAGTGAIKDPGMQLGGLKGVKLAGDDSTTIREKLQEMISAREAQKGGFDAWLGHMQSYGGRPEDFVTNRRNYAADVAKREGDTFDMRTQLAQMNTNERLADQTAREQQNFFSSLTQTNPQTMQPKPPQAGGALPGAAPQPQAAGAPQPQAGGLPVAAPQAAAPLTPSQQADLAQLYRTNPQAAITKKIELQRVSEAERQLQAAGLKPGTNEYNSALMLKVTGAGAFAPNEVRGPQGTQQQTPLQAAGQVVGGAQRSTPQVQPAGAATVAPQMQPAGSAVAPMAQTPATPPATSNTGFAPGSKEDLEVRAAQAKTEAENLGKTLAAEQEFHRSESSSAPDNAQRAQRMQADIRTANTLVGKLSQGGTLSAFLGLVDKGVQAGTVGTINMPGFKDAVVKMDPAAKDPKVMDAYTRLAKDLEVMKLDYSRKVFKGQGAVTENERKLISSAVGDVDYMSPANLMKVAKATEIEARNRADQDKLWKQMENSGRTWKQYRDSPELKELQRAQFYRTAKAFGQKDALWPSDAQRP
jgi:hypothetical protein